MWLLDIEFSRKIWDNIFRLSQAVFRVTHLFPKDEILKRYLREKITEILYQSSPIFGSKNYENMIREMHNFRSFLFTSKNCSFVNDKNIIILVKECEKIIGVLEQKNREILTQIYAPSLDKNLDKNTVAQVADSASGSEVKIAMQDQPNFNKNIAVASMRDGGVLAKNVTQESSVKSSFANAKVGVKKNQLVAQVKVENSDSSSMIGFSVLGPRHKKILDHFGKFPDQKIRLKDLSRDFKSLSPRTIRKELRYLCDNGFLSRDGFGPGSFYFVIKNHR